MGFTQTPCEVASDPSLYKLKSRTGGEVSPNAMDMVMLLWD
jgi:hypothetical protein